MWRFYVKLYFFNVYGGEKIVLGIVVEFWLVLTWPFGGNGEFMALKHSPGVLQLVMGWSFMN